MRFVLNDYSPGEIVHFIRESTLNTQKDFALRIGKGEATVKQYESGLIDYSLPLFLCMMYSAGGELVVLYKGKIITKNPPSQGALFKDIRKAHSKTQTAFAPLMSRSSPSYALYELDQQSCKMSVFLGALKPLGITVTMYLKEQEPH